jgi:hypothetical protein
MTTPTTTTSMSVFKGGPTLLDLMIDVSELRISVNGPQMLFEKLTLVTTLSLCSQNRSAYPSESRKYSGRYHVASWLWIIVAGDTSSIHMRRSKIASPNWQSMQQWGEYERRKVVGATNPTPLGIHP